MPRTASFTPGLPRALRWLLLTLTMTLLTSPTLAAQTPVKSSNDRNHYRHLTLENDLQVLLVSAPGSEKAAASLNVAIGSGDDPADRAGLAHFLEHMLFLGTEKYPEPGEYQQFISSHGGHHNAFTAFRDTNYFFDVQAEHLQPALDRFAQQFSAPLFTTDLVERERRAVHSEFTAKMREDGRRFHAAKKEAFNPDHPYTGFSVGNMTTLEDTETNPLRPDLVQFWREHYSADRMTLAVYGPQSLDQLEAMVLPRFGAIENRQLGSGRDHPPMFRDGDLPALLQVEALRDLRTLTLSFPIASQIANYRTKPASYVASLLGHEGPGSLFDVLKTAGWVESLSAGSGTDDGHQATLELNMSLTPKGLEHRDDILGLTFAYIDQVRQHGISEQRFEEMQQQATINFRFQEKQEPIHRVTRLSMELRHVAPEDVLRAPWMMERYDPQGYRAVLNQLTPDNVLVSELSQQELGDDAPTTAWYNTPYRLGPLDTEALTAPAGMADQLALPEPNPFLPENLELVAGETMEHPEIIASDDLLTTWYARDTRFDTPKANVFLSLRSPVARDTARDAVLSKLLVDAIKTNLNAWAYPARLAGLDYSLYAHLRGLTLRIGGYNDKQHRLLTRILPQIANPTLDPQRFAIARRNLLDALRNKAQARPVQQLADFIQTSLIQGAWPTDAQIAAAESVTFEELQAYAQRFTRALDPVLMVHGNVTEASALNLAALVNALLLTDTRPAQVASRSVRALPDGETRAAVAIEHPDTGYTLYSQGEDSSFRERARFRLLAQVIGSPFYEEIRTRRQLGYIVYATSFEMLETPALGLVVQSPEASADDIEVAVTDFTEAFDQQLAELTEAELAREKQAVISGLLDQDRKLGDASQRFWREIDREQLSFDSRQRLADAVRAISAEELHQTFRRALLERARALRAVSTDQPSDGQSKAIQQLVEQLTSQPAVPAS